MIYIMLWSFSFLSNYTKPDSALLKDVTGLYMTEVQTVFDRSQSWFYHHKMIIIKTCFLL